jgi:undecaprenyl-diphosphatase
MIGGILWVTTFVLSGYFFGNIPFIKDNFSIGIYAVILISLLPAVIGFLKAGKAGRYIKTTYERVCTYIKEVKEDKALVRYILIGAVLSVISIFIFVEIARECVAAASSGLDISASGYVSSIRSEALDNVFKVISSSGGFIPVAAISAATVFVLSCRRKRRESVFFVFNIAGICLLNELLTFLFKRERPSINQLAYASGYSFPSSSAMIFMGVTFFIAYFIIKYFKSRRLAYILSGMAVIYSVFVGASGVYVGINYLSDVLAGWAAGLLWITLSVLMLKLVNRKKESHSLNIELECESNKK